MPPTMRNVAIAQQRDEKRYRLVHGGGSDRPKLTFKVGDYVLLQQQPSSTLDVPTRPHILRVVEIMPFGVAVLEGRDVAGLEERIKNVVHNPLPILGHNAYEERFYCGPSVHRREHGGVQTRRCYAISATRDTTCRARTSH